MKRIHQLPNGESEVEYGIYEVYYDEDGDGKHGWTINPVSVVGESTESLRQTLQWMLDALDKEALNFDDGEPDSESS